MTRNLICAGVVASVAGLAVFAAPAASRADVFLQFGHGHYGGFYPSYGYGGYAPYGYAPYVVSPGYYDYGGHYGGYGYSREYPLERTYRDIRGLCIGAGTIEAQLNYVGTNVARGRATVSPGWIPQKL